MAVSVRNKPVLRLLKDRGAVPYLILPACFWPDQCQDDSLLHQSGWPDQAVLPKPGLVSGCRSVPINYCTVRQ